MKKIGLPGLVLLGILGSTAQAEFFKWVDANGKAHYSDRKTNPQAQKLDIDTSEKTADQRSLTVEQRLRQQENYADFLQSERLKREEDRQKAKREKTQRKVERKICAALKARLDSYSQGRYRWYELDETSGERVYVTDNQIEVKKARLRSKIKANCS